MGQHRIEPYLLYEDVPAAIEWLSKAFGFRETLRFTGEDGRVSHAEIRIGDALVMLGNPGGDYQDPVKHGHRSQILVVYVDDVDKHYEQAVAAGATILREPRDEDYGLRMYRSVDPFGFEWDFAQTLREVTPEEWGAVSAQGASPQGASAEG